ncbi:MAG: hypothetical protein IGS54_24890 [Elainella sp. C42_A2020_010]|nr:hypothetical protein [Elainella sp. C42_A2020_010]RNJ70330.1 MAG: hypothetical protein EDM05_04130 [Leptolyngbya sp. IPPAS B-1204]
MADEFLSDLPFDFNSPNLPASSNFADRERLRLILIGSTAGVQEMIHRQHQAGIADAGSWSRLLPVPNSDEVMSILLLYRRRG